MPVVLRPTNRTAADADAAALTAPTSGSRDNTRAKPIRVSGENPTISTGRRWYMRRILSRVAPIAIPGVTDQSPRSQPVIPEFAAITGSDHQALSFLL